MFLTNLNLETAYPAIEKRNNLITEGAFSDPEEKIAVITSLAMNNCVMSPKESLKLRLEALAILDTLRLQAKEVVDILSPTVSDINAIFQDPSITDLCVIGEGAIGNLYVVEDDLDPTCCTDYDWIAVSEAADHLKTGNFFQRMCSVVSFSPVIWSTFAAADLRKIWISEVPRFDPIDLHSLPEQGLTTAYLENAVSYDSMRDLADCLRDRGKVVETAEVS